MLVLGFRGNKEMCMVFPVPGDFRGSGRETFIPANTRNRNFPGPWGAPGRDGWGHLRVVQEAGNEQNLLFLFSFVLLD